MQRQGLQQWLERKAAIPAFALAAAAMIVRAAPFYSGGALDLAHILSPLWMRVYDAATGFGLAMGCELLASIAGRYWQRNEAEAREAEARGALSKHARAALAGHYRHQARIGFIFSMIGLVASAAGGFAFLWASNPKHDVWGAIFDALPLLLILAVVYFLGVLHQDMPEDPARLAQAEAQGLRLEMTRAAFQRMKMGEATGQDVRLGAESLPEHERARFRAILAPDTRGDPLWTVPQIVAWLAGDRADALERERIRRRVSRTLKDAEDSGEDIRRDERRQYLVLRSVVLKLLADYFVTLYGERDTARSLAGQPAAALAVYAPAGGGMTGSGQDTDARGTGIAPATLPAVTRPRHKREPILRLTPEPRLPARV